MPLSDGCQMDVSCITPTEVRSLIECVAVSCRHASPSHTHQQPNRDHPRRWHSERSDPRSSSRQRRPTACGDHIVLHSLKFSPLRFPGGGPSATTQSREPVCLSIHQRTGEHITHQLAGDGCTTVNIDQRSTRRWMGRVNGSKRNRCLPHYRFAITAACWLQQQ